MQSPTFQSIRTVTPSVASTSRVLWIDWAALSDETHNIRHYWEKAVTCKNPRYGVWGGPPGSGGDEGKPGAIKPAEGLANAPRGQVKLPQVVQTAVPELGLAAPKPRPLRPGEKAPAKP